jgi:hypothetical protein
MQTLTHPEHGRPLNELERLLWRFRMVAHEAQAMVRGLNAYDDASTAINTSLWFTLSNHALIIVSKFLEVWQDSGSLAKTEPRIVGVRRALTPLIDRIEIWEGIRELRNTALAHAYLDKSGNLVTPWHPITAGRAPTYHAEIVLLLHLVHIAVLCVLSVFEKEYIAIDSLAGPGKVEQPTPGPGIQFGTEIKPVMTELAKQIGPSVERECGVIVAGKFAEAFHAALRPRSDEDA